MRLQLITVISWSVGDMVAQTVGGDGKKRREKTVSSMSHADIRADSRKTPRIRSDLTKVIPENH